MKKRGCAYPCWEGGVTVDAHIYNKDEFCIICGDKGEAPMTDWKQQARDHEHSANEYAQLYHKERQTNAALLEALEQIASVTPADIERWGRYKTFEAINTEAIEAIRKATA